jgi:ribosomal protein L37AE/L43A
MYGGLSKVREKHLAFKDAQGWWYVKQSCTKSSCVRIHAGIWRCFAEITQL